MEPPPAPSSGRFRLRIQIIDKKDAANPAAVPLRTFIIAKNVQLPLVDLTLKELCNEVIKRYQQLYLGESLFAVDTTQDSSASDLWLGEHVRDIFEDNDIFRVVKGASIRVSVDPHRSRSLSVQTGTRSEQRRPYPSTFCDSSSNINHRLYNINPGQPIYSREQMSETGSIGPQSQTHAFVSSQLSIIPDSQRIALGHTEAPRTRMDAGLEISSTIAETIAESEYGQNGTEFTHDGAESVRNSPELGNSHENYNMSNGHLFDDVDRAEAEILQHPSIAANRTLSHELEKNNAGAELESILPQSSSKRKFSHDDDEKVHKHRSSNSIISHPQDNSSGAKRLKRVNTNVRAKATGRKNTYDFESDTELRVGPETRLIGSSNGVGQNAPPTTSLQDLKLSTQSNTLPYYNSSPMGNNTNSRADSNESLPRSIRSSPVDEAERLRRAKEAQRIALEKQRQREVLERERAKEASEKQQAKEALEQERQRKAAKQREDEENALNEQERQELQRERETLRLEARAREKREKAAWDRILAKREQAKLQFEADKRIIMKEKALEQERLAADEEKKRLLTEAANSRAVDVEKERNLAAGAKQRRENQDAERKFARAKDKKRKDAELIAKREAQESNANAAAETKKKLTEEQARRNAEHATKQKEFRVTQAKLTEATRDADTNALREVEDRRKLVVASASKRRIEEIGTFEAQTNKNPRKHSSSRSEASMDGSVGNQRQTQTQETSTFINPTPPSSAGGMLARAVQRFNDASQNDEIQPLKVHPESSQNDVFMPCTQQRRAEQTLLLSQSSSQAATSQSPEPHIAAGVAVKTQMARPDSLNQSVSLPLPPKAQNSTVHLKKKLIQTTLIPDRPNVSKVKKATAAKSSSKQVAASKSSKGKGKVVESPGSPPNPILISSGESSSYSDVDSDDLEISYDRAAEGRPDGPAYQTARNSNDIKFSSSALSTSSKLTSGEAWGRPINRHASNSEYTTSPLIEPTSSQINPGTQEVLRRIANIGFPTPAYVVPQSDPEPSQIGSRNTQLSSRSDESKLNGTAANKDLTLKRERDIGLSTNRTVKNPDPEKTSRFRQSLRDMNMQSWASPDESRPDTSQQEAFNSSQAKSTGNIASRQPVVKTKPPDENPPEDNYASDDISASEDTQSEVDKQLLPLHRESPDRVSRPEPTDSSSDSNAPLPSMQIRSKLSVMTKDKRAQVAAKKAYENSEPVLHAKRELEENIQREKEEAAAALEMSSTDTESSSDGKTSEDSRDEDDPIAQRNLYNGTGFRKRANMGNIGVRKEWLDSTNAISRRGRKYQKNLKTGKMVKVGKYESIDAKTGKVVDDSRRWVAKIKRNIRV